MNKMEKQALAPLKVLDLTHYIAGPYCTKLLAGFGADVIKIERPGRGDKIRSMGPFYKQEQGLENSIPFLWLNTGKKSITLNLKKDKGIQVFKRLLADADVVVDRLGGVALAVLVLLPSLGRFVAVDDAAIDLSQADLTKERHEVVLENALVALDLAFAQTATLHTVRQPFLQGELLKLGSGAGSWAMPPV